MTTTLKHYVDFYSPGTFVSESSRRPIEAWDTTAAVELANGIMERHGAKPYGFRFVTMREHPPIDDGAGGFLEVTPKLVEQSGLHYLGGTVLTFDDLEFTDTEQRKRWRICRDNMRCNDEPVIIMNDNSWRFTGFFGPEVCRISASGIIDRRGWDEDLKAYREKMIAQWAQEKEAERKEWEANRQAKGIEV